jgi:glutamate dehydrogenase (NADP+)
MRFCQSFMTELSRHIGQDTDIPDGGLGVGAREIGFLFGMYKKQRNEFSGVLTGKGLQWSGSYIRPQAAGYGVGYFAAEMMAARNETLAGKTCLISGLEIAQNRMLLNWSAEEVDQRLKTIMKSIHRTCLPECRAGLR